MLNFIKNVILIWVVPLALYSTQEFTVVCRPIIDLAKTISYSSQDGKISVLAVGGCPGVGKTFFAEKLSTILNEEGILTIVIKMDDYIKDKKTREQYGTGWDVRHLDSESLHRDLMKIFNGETIITKPTLDEVTREKGIETLNLSHVRLIILEGLYSLSMIPPIDYFKYANAGIYMSGDEEDIFKWRWYRETKKSKPKTFEQFKKHMQDIFQDYHLHVEPTKSAANYVVQKDENHHYRLNVQ